ncbi:hypothetical protein CXU22_02405 [Akkermansia muciniphila]|uniref:Uncharacterized protein n=1 Tax=Akkermansia muciniphila TaxID=239935 RepID=A0A2N8HGN6_9BACT|nr:hypothetical protein CXU22_02405 [Akkermansia muciniphila]
MERSGIPPGKNSLFPLPSFRLHAVMLEDWRGGTTGRELEIAGTLSGKGKFVQWETQVFCR